MATAVGGTTPDLFLWLSEWPEERIRSAPEGKIGTKQVFSCASLSLLWQVLETGEYTEKIWDELENLAQEILL